MCPWILEGAGTWSIHGLGSARKAKQGSVQLQDNRFLQSSWSLTLMVAREGSGQSLLMYTNALWLFAHTAPLSKFCPAVTLAAVSLASAGPAR